MGGTGSKKNFKVKHGLTTNLKRNSIIGSREELSSCKWSNEPIPLLLIFFGNLRQCRHKRSCHNVKLQEQVFLCIMFNLWGRILRQEMIYLKWFNRWNPPWVWFLVIFPSRNGMRRWKNTFVIFFLFVAVDSHNSKFLAKFFLIKPEHVSLSWFSIANLFLQGKISASNTFKKKWEKSYFCKKWKKLTK